MNAITNYLEKFGSNFLVASMIPSLGLVILSLVVFDPILKFSAVLGANTGIHPLLDISVWVIVPTILIGYTLTALNTFVLKVFEGYVSLPPFSRVTRAGYARKARELIEERDRVKAALLHLEQKKLRTVEEEQSLATLRNDYYALVVAYDQHYPPPNTEIMPTRFGNILKASEAYSGTRYGIDGVEFWTRLWHVIPASYRQGIDDARNELSFLVNMAALSIVFFVLCIGAIVLSSPAPGHLNVDAFLANSMRYMLAGTGAIVSIWFFNEAALFSVGDFGMMIRSAYDLFRFDLLEQFHLEHPKNSVDEFKVWKNLGQLIVLGRESLDFEPLEYKIKKQKP